MPLVIPSDPAERDALAGEYVLGTLDARRAAEVAASIERDPALAAAVAAWEARLAPLTVLAVPEAPPPALWSRIESTLGRGAVPVPVRPRLGVGLAIWRGWALGASAVAAGLALFLVARPPAPEPAPRLMTVLLTDRDAPAWLVEAEGNALRLAAVGAQPATPDERVRQLWALPQGATAPTSLGLLPREAGRFTVQPQALGITPHPGMLVEITLEPPGGSPTGRPTGPILFIGRLTAATGT
jgi:anti-sigma-K factor RskA